MTTEILMNYLFNLNQQTEQPQLQFEMDIHNDLACVVFDEVHYINDKDRGQVWEKNNHATSTTYPNGHAIRHY